MTLALICAAVILAAFIFLPWLGRELSANGARLLSDHLYGAPGAPAMPLLWLVPLTACAGLGLALWGVWAPERARLSSGVILLLGVVGLAYFGRALGRPSEMAPGAGQWLALASTFGLVAQFAAALPWAGGRPGPWHRMLGALPPPPRRAVPYLFLLPGLALYAIWVIAPTLATLFLSLTHWDGVSRPRFAGLANFRHLFAHDRLFAEALLNNLRWLAVFISLPVLLGLALALLFHFGRRRSPWLKASFYAPLVLSLPVIGLLWSWLYNPRLGLINALLARLGVSEPPGWLGDRDLAIWCVIAAAVWRQAGYVMVLYLAGLKSVDPSLIDAARVDGAGRWTLVWRVILPLLAPATTIVLIVSVIDSLRAFDLVAIMTRGGQGTQVLANLMFMEAFNNYRMGYGAAIAVVLFALSLGFISLYLARVARAERAA